MRQRPDYKESLTNEVLQKKFKSQFDLVRYAIQLAVRKVELNKDATYPDLENIATEVLEEIACGRDSYEDECEEDCSEVDACEVAELERIMVKPKKKAKVKDE